MVSLYRTSVAVEVTGVTAERRLWCARPSRRKRSAVRICTCVSHVRNLPQQIPIIFVAIVHASTALPLFIHRFSTAARSSQRSDGQYCRGPPVLRAPDAVDDAVVIAACALAGRLQDLSARRARVVKLR